jgi:hypothetical protein
MENAHEILPHAQQTANQSGYHPQGNATVIHLQGPTAVHSLPGVIAK